MASMIINAKLPFNRLANLLATIHDQHLPFLQKKISHQTISTTLLSMLHNQNDKLVRRIAKNMNDELRKHNLAHVELEKMRFGKESTVFFRSLSHTNQI